MLRGGGASLRTGGGKGIGAACASCLGHEGCKIVVADIDEAAAARRAALPVPAACVLGAHGVVARNICSPKKNFARAVQATPVLVAVVRHADLSVGC